MPKAMKSEFPLKNQSVPQTFDLETAYVMLLKAYVRQHQSRFSGVQPDLDDDQSA